MITIVGPHDKNFIKGKKVFNVTSCSTDFCKALSPMILGPCKLYRDFVSKTVENGWQYSKVYSEYDNDGIPSVDYFKWAIEGWSNFKGIRYPKGKGAKPLYSFWNDECLDYIEARKKIYIPLYTRAARENEAFRILQCMYDKGEDLILWDFNGRITSETNKEMILNPSKPLGHGFVLKLMLEGLL